MNFDNQGIFGFDVSFWNDDNQTPNGIDFYKMKSYGANFVIIRAGQGGVIDQDFNTNWENAKKAGIPRSAYFFYDPRIDPIRQAQVFAAAIPDTPEGRLWVDLEFPTAWGGRYTASVHWQAMMEEVKRLTGLRVGVYTANWWWAAMPVHDSAYFGRHPLWVAQYVNDPIYVKLPAPWTSALIWQDGTPPIGLEVGVESKEIDHNYFNGGAAEFDLEFGVTITTPPVEVITMKGKMLNFTVNVRDANNTVVAALKVNDVVYGPVSTASTPRISFDKIYRADGSIYNLGKVCTAVTTNGGTPPIAYMTLTNESEPTTPIDPPIVTPPAGVVHVINVRNDGRISVDGGAYE